MREWALIFISGISSQFTTFVPTTSEPTTTQTTSTSFTTTTGTAEPTTQTTTATLTTTRTFGGTEVVFTTDAVLEEFTTMDTPDLTTTVEPTTTTRGTTTRTFGNTEVAFTTDAVLDEFTTMDTPDLTTTVEPTTTTTGLPTTTRTFGGTEIVFTTAAVFDEFTTMDNLDTSTTLATTTSIGLGSTVGFTTEESVGGGSALGTTEMIYTTMLPTTTATQITTTTTELLTTTTSPVSTIATDTTSTTFPEFDTGTTTEATGGAGAAGINQYAPGEQVSMMPYGDDDQAVAGAYGDPHFMVRSEHGEPICFDYNPLLASNNMLLLTDPRTSLTVLAKPEERGNTGRLFMSELTIMTPNAVTLTINSAGVFLDGEVVSEVGAKSGIHVISDLTFRTTWAKDGNHEHTNVEIEDGPIFLIKGNLKKESLSFAIMDASGISRKSKGIIGGFIADDSYIIHKSTETPTLGVVQAGKTYASAELKHYHREEKCWVIDEEDALRMINKV